MTELRFPVKGAAALACYFVRGNWPKRETLPVLETVGPDLTLVFKFEAQVVRDLQEILSNAGMAEGRLRQSARRLRMMLAAQLVGRVIPDDRRYPFGASEGVG
jgi:hypothetical protein